MACKIVYQEALKDLKQIDKVQAKRIIKKIDEDLANNPGKDKPLEGKRFKGLYSYRIGDYRVIYRLVDELNEDNQTEKVILIRSIEHRRQVYK